MEEPNAAIRWTIFLFAGGDAGLWGLICLAIVVALALWPLRKRPIRGVAFGLSLVALLCLPLCSPVPVPIWFTWPSAAWLITVLWLVVRTRSKLAANASSTLSIKSTRIQWVWFSLPLIWLALVLLLEVPFHLLPSPDPSASTLLVIGDSVTAGLNDGEDTWPQQLARQVKLEVLDASQPGATLRSARKQNQMFGDQPGLVVLEIGGNDMLEGLAVSKFEDDLATLLQEVVRPGRYVVMFELPLPPLCARYGQVQRRLAIRHGVSLIPKRSFATVLTTAGSTVDGIHLSAKGQSQMAALMQSVLGMPQQPNAGQYQRFESRFVTQ